MRILKQSTAVTVKVGPFVDDTDGKTAETGLTIQKADVRLTKNGGNMAAASADQGSSDAGAPHDELGEYDVSLDTTDTNTLGHLKVMVTKSGALPVWDEFTVLNANVFDSIVSGTDKLQTDAVEINSVASAAARLALSAGTIVIGAVDTATNTHTPTATEFQADNVTEATADHFLGRVVIFTSGALAGQATTITGYEQVGGIGQFAVTALTEAPANNDGFVVV